MLSDNKIKIIQKFLYFIISTPHSGAFGDVRDRTAGEKLKHSSSHGLRKEKLMRRNEGK